SGWLYRPRDASGPGPIVLSFHGGPEAQERPMFNTTYQALLARGIAVFAPNVRGSGGFGKRFVNLDNGALRVDAVHDIKDWVEYGDPATQGELLRRLSPIRRLDRIRAPVLVLHGANDTNTPVTEAEQVVAGLKGRGVAVEYVLFPDEGHGFRKPRNRVRAAVATVRWFEKHLKVR